MGSTNEATPQLQSRTSYLYAHSSTVCDDYEHGEPLPLGQPISFQSDLFVGKAFCRLKPITSDPGHEAYFKDRKRLYQLIVQGRFKEQMRFDDLKMGDFYEKPLSNIPRGTFMKLYGKFMETVCAGLVMDLTSDHPKILTALGSANVMRVDNPGEEPDISTGEEVQENTTLLFGKEKFTSSNARKSYLSKPSKACKYETNPDHVYTFELYDHLMCFGSYYQYIMMGQKVDMAKIMNGQPLSFAAVTNDQKFLWKFPVWNERTERYAEKEQE